MRRRSAEQRARLRREDRGAKGAEGWSSWEGCPPPQLTRESGGASWAPPAGSGVEPWPPTHSRHISQLQKPSSRHNALRSPRYCTLCLRKNAPSL